MLALASSRAISFTPEEQTTCPRYGLRSNIEKLLFVHHRKQSTNPKDKVFALIRISEAQTAVTT
jgi:hypothetical protein